MKHPVRSWLLAAGLPLVFGHVAGCYGDAGDEAPYEDPAANPAEGNAPGAPSAPGAPDSEAPGAPDGAQPGDGPDNGVDAVPAPQKPRSFTRDLSVRFQEEVGITGEHTYLVHFRGEPLATYGGGVSGLAATSTAGYGKIDTRSPSSLAYKSYLLGAQQQTLQTIESRLARRVKVMHHYTTAANAVTARLTQDEAKQISLLPEVAFIERDVAVEPETDRGPLFIGAPSIWDGSVAELPSQGEGVTIGIIDSGPAIQVEIDGVTTIHPSFDSIGHDGYVHTNPLGDGVYLGGCAQHPEWCSDKLIGAYSFLQGQPNPGIDPAAPNDDILWRFKDTSGHGSHVASTAGGNVLHDVPLPDAEGNPSSFAFARISGVAPHANLVAFKVCAPSCFPSDTVAAVEQAIEDGVVDVLNYSISSSPGSPWLQSVSSAFLSARAAGIFVAVSAGNNGPTAGTAGRGNGAPWLASVAALSHDRRFPNKELNSFAGGDAPPPPAITGAAVTGGFTGRIVYAADFPVGNPGEPNFEQPQQCLAPFPAGTFEPDMIVVCDRGTAARVDKGRFVRDGGAGAIVLANITGGSNTVDADPHVIPGININIAQGNALKAWLASGTGHTATITPSSQPVADPAVADIMAAFSSRGPFADFDILAPNVATPGLAIFAAGAQILFNHPGAPSVRGLFGTIQGTSMASPHMAGSAALLRSIHPDWTDAEILSAVMTTGNTVVRKENGVTPANPFDYGGGRARLALAAAVGLVFDEPASGFVAGNPAIGGEPLALNVATLVEDTCINDCAWTRTVRATRSASWSVTASPFVTVTPAAFTLAEGDTQALSITANVEGMALDTFAFGTVTFTATDPALPAQTVQVVVRPAKSNVNRALAVRATRDAESVTVSGLRAIPIADLSVETIGLGRADREERLLAQDSNTASPFDDLDDGVTFKLVQFPDNAEQFIAETLNSTSPDLDLFVGLDSDGDGLPSQAELVCTAATAATNERCTIQLGGDLAGLPPFWVLVQNFRSAEPGGSDTFDMATTAVGPGSEGLAVIGPSGSVPGGQPFELRLAWSTPMEPGDILYGRASVYADASLSAAAFLGNVDVRIERGPDDVSIVVPERARVPESMTVRVRVQPNFTPTTRTYQIDVPVPPGTSYIAGSGGAFDGDSVRFTVVRVPTTPAQGQVQELTFRVRVNGGSQPGTVLQFEQVNTVDAPDTAEESSVAPSALQAFTFTGFRAPITPGSNIQIGTVAPVKFRLVDAVTKAPIFFEIAQAEVRDASGQLVATGQFTGVFEFEFAFDTTGLAPGQYTITAILSDSFPYSMKVNLVP
jgi:hypothetical protein